MKRVIANCLATSGLSLFLLTIVASAYSATLLCIDTVYQVIAANTMIHLGFCLLKRFESTYFAVELAVELGYLLTVLIVFGAIFGWYSNTPIWLLILMGVVTYIFGTLIGILHIKSDVDRINKQLKHRREQGSENCNL